MKSIILYLLLSLFIIGKDAELETYSKTGHDQFSEIVFVDDERDLLVDMTQTQIDKQLDRIKAKFIGVTTKYSYTYKDIEYISTVVFSRSNKTSEKFVFDYSLQTVEYQERSLNVKGSVSYKNVSKKKEVENQFAADASISYTTTESFRETESSSMKVTVYPDKKITLRVVGEGKISMGYSKTHFLWICFKKGAWETVDVVTSYFELVEEDA